MQHRPKAREGSRGLRAGEELEAVALEHASGQGAPETLASLLGHALEHAQPSTEVLHSPQRAWGRHGLPPWRFLAGPSPQIAVVTRFRDTIPLHD